MKQIVAACSIMLVTGLVFSSCKKEANTEQEISQETLTKIYNHGFGTSNVVRVEEGYMVEGDIVLTEEYLNTAPGGHFLRIANEEQ